MLSDTVEYALRAVVLLASEPERPMTTATIAERTQVPAAYLAKILQGLTREGVVRSQRGVGGGITLVKSPEHLSILEVVNAVEPLQRIRSCPLKLRSHGVKLCPLHRRLDNALATMEEAFRATTLAEVIAEPTESKPLCESSPQPLHRRRKHQP